MEKHSFYKLINSPDRLSPASLEPIKGLTEQYPYFQAARTLYLINLKRTGNAAMGSQLHSQASLIPCRQQLYRLLHPTATPAAGENTTEGNPGTTAPIPESPFILLDGGNHADAVTISIEATPNTTDTDILELIDGEPSSSATGQGANPASLIDTFLHNMPTIERPPMPQQGETVENEDISGKSVELAGELASEPLAQIYISQGYFEKALGIYEKLCLKYPEKSSYFADLIQQLKERINSKH